MATARTFGTWTLWQNKLHRKSSSCCVPKIALADRSRSPNMSPLYSGAAQTLLRPAQALLKPAQDALREAIKTGLGKARWLSPTRAMTGVTFGHMVPMSPPLRRAEHLYLLIVSLSRPFMGALLPLV